MADKHQSPQESKSYAITTNESSDSEEDNYETASEENHSNLLISLSDVEPVYVRSDTVVDLSVCATDSNASQINFIHELDCTEISNLDSPLLHERPAYVDLSENNQILFTGTESNSVINVIGGAENLLTTRITNVSDSPVILEGSSTNTDYETSQNETITNENELAILAENMRDRANLFEANSSDQPILLPSTEPSHSSSDTFDNLSESVTGSGKVGDKHLNNDTNVDSSNKSLPGLKNDSSENESSLILEPIAMTIDNSNDDGQILTDENSNARPTAQPIEYESFIDLSTFISRSADLPVEQIPQVVVGRYDRVPEMPTGYEEHTLHRSRSPLLDDFEIENAIVDVRDFENTRASSASPRRSPSDVSPRRSPRHVSPRRSPRHVSPHRSPRHVSPHRSPRHVSPRISPRHGSPHTSQFPHHMSPRRSLGHVYEENITETGVSVEGNEESSLLNTNDQLVPEKDSDSDDAGGVDI